MAEQDFSSLSIDQIQSGLVAKEFSAREVAQAAIDRVQAVDGRINAFLDTTPEMALAAAESVDAGSFLRK